MIAAFVGLAVIFTVAWVVCRRVNNYSFVDVVWAYSFAATAGFYALTGEGWLPRRIAIAALVGAWSLRLGTYLAGRVGSHHPEEDPRYKALRDGCEGKVASQFLKFFLAQAVLAWLLMLPVYLVCREAATTFHWLELIGLVVWGGALVGEGVADTQLKRFKGMNTDCRQVCREGMWAYSRHPNYFFQSLLWWGLFLMALPAPWGWAAILAPLAMLFFLTRVTGIPLTEKLAVESKGEAYRNYQRTTNALLPGPTKS